MVEHDNARRPGLRLHQRFHLWVVDAPHLRFVEEIGDLGIVADEMKAAALEHEVPMPAIVEGDATRIGLAAAAPVVRARRTGFREYLGAVGDDVIERHLDRLGFGIGLGGLRWETFDRLSHGPLLFAPGAASTGNHREIVV